MAETEPVVVRFEADNAAFVAGTEQVRQALRSTGNEAETTSVKFKGVDSQTRSLFRTMVEMRVASMSVEHVFKSLGIQSEALNKIFGGLNFIMDVGISIMAIYRAALAAKAVAHWLTAKAALAESAAEAGTVSFGVGIAIIAAAGLAAFAAITAFPPPHAAQGGIVMPRYGGTLVNVAEAGYPEAIIPLKSGTSYGDTHVTMNIYSNDPDEIMRKLGRRIGQLKTAGY